MNINNFKTSHNFATLVTVHSLELIALIIVNRKVTFFEFRLKAKSQELAAARETAALVDEERKESIFKPVDPPACEIWQQLKH